jgi:hypothetical protein
MKCRIFFTLFAATVLLGGCSSTSQSNNFPKEGVETFLPELISMATGPVAGLLTNGNGFTAQFTMTLQDATEPPLKMSGQIFSLGGKLRLEAAFDKSTGKSLRAGSFGVIWDVTAQNGFVFSEALQGYAPIYASTQCTNLLTEVIEKDIEEIEGHLVDKANVTFMNSNGQTTSLQLLRAHDLDDLSLKIYSRYQPQTFLLAMSNIQPLVQAEELFLVPDGLTKYEGEAAMLNELAVRQANIYNKKEEDGGVNINYKPTGGGY